MTDALGSRFCSDKVSCRKFAAQPGKAIRGVKLSGSIVIVVNICSDRNGPSAALINVLAILCLPYNISFAQAHTFLAPTGIKRERRYGISIMAGHVCSLPLIKTDFNWFS